MAAKVRVLFVCTGNICRSPTAEAVFAALVARAGLTGRVAADSAGTIDFHLGKPPDVRSQRAAQRRGYELGALRARQVVGRDLGDFDLIVGLGPEHVRYVQALAADDARARVCAFTDFLGDRDLHEIPDPYYGSAEDFEAVLDLIELGAAGILEHVRADFLGGST